MLPFLLDAGVAAFLLFSVGTILLRAMRLPWTWALVGAPAISLCTYSVFGEVYAVLSIPATPFSIALIPLACSCFLMLLSSSLFRRELELPDIAWKDVATFACVGLAFGFFTFVRALPSPNAIFQSEDIVKHALQIQAFVDARTFSSFHSTVYQGDLSIAPIRNSGFYPCGWHVLCALVDQVVQGDVPTVMNAANYVLSSLVYPLSVLGLLAALFEGEKAFRIAGPIACASISAFPWGMLVFGPLFPNLCALACVPSVLCLFIRASSIGEVSLAQRSVLLLCFLVASVGMAVSHPNAIFSAAVILIPYCVHAAFHVELSSNAKLLSPRVRSALVLAICALCWTALRFSSPFSSVTSFNWAAYTSPWQSLFNVFFLAYTDGFSSVSFVAQPIVALALVIGFSEMAKRKSASWLPYSYLFAVVICMVCMSTEGELKHLLGGFWYTDPFRLAATAGIAAVPLVSLGLYRMAQWLCATLRKKHLEGELSLPMPTTSLALAVLAFGIIAPSFTVPGMFSIETAFTKTRLDVKAMYSMENPYSTEERAFVERVKEVVPEGALVINDPLDGSILAYGFDDLRCYYRIRSGYGGASETPESAIIRERLCDLADDPDVRDAVQSVGAEYVIILDTKGSTDSFLQWYYAPELFEGITSINPATPGFELVLADDDLRLYRLAA